MVTNVDSSQEKAVMEALENPKYFWRTTQGLVTETGLSEQVINTVFKSNHEIIVKCRIPSTNGDALFTTRAHFRRKASFGEKLMGALRNRLGGST